MTTKFLDVAKFITLTPVFLLISCKLSFPIVGLEIFSLHSFALKLPDKIFMSYLETDQKHASVPHRSCPLYHSLIFALGLHIQKNNIIRHFFLQLLCFFARCA
jgi:hypothetical protein